MDILASNLALVVSVLWLLYHTVMFTTPVVYASLSLGARHKTSPWAATAAQAGRADAASHGQTVVQPAVGGWGRPWQGTPAGIRYADDPMFCCRVHCVV